MGEGKEDERAGHMNKKGTEFDQETLKDIAIGERPWLIFTRDEAVLSDITTYSIRGEEVIGFRMVFAQSEKAPAPGKIHYASLDAVVKMGEYTEKMREKRLKEIGI
jgi:hypothetical protein